MTIDSVLSPGLRISLLSLLYFLHIVFLGFRESAIRGVFDTLLIYKHGIREARVR